MVGMAPPSRSTPQSSLFQAESEPLAARMRPRTIDEFVGQAHVLGPGRLLRRAILADRLSSVIFHGPPGTGKTTLARVIAGTTEAEFVALGVDYNIFLVTRAREEAPTHGTGLGVLRALSATGGVITSAGVLLAAVFATLGVLPLVVLAQLGVVIGIGVLLDTLLVRTVLVPSLVVLLGERFWWPRRVR